MLIGGLAGLGWSTALVYFDVTSSRLPNALTVPAGAIAVGVCAFWPVGLWGLIWPAIYLCAGAGVGGGDVKLAVPLGIVCALAAGVTGVVTAILLASVITLLTGIVLRLPALAHGPAMLISAWLVGLYGFTEMSL